MAVLWRYVLAWLGCLGIMNVYFCRNNLSVAIVDMVGVAARSNLTPSQCPGSAEQEEEVEKEGEFQWSITEQEQVKGGYYVGYAACQVPAAWLATRLGYR